MSCQGWTLEQMSKRHSSRCDLALWALASLFIATVPPSHAQSTGKAIKVSPVPTTATGGQRWALIVGINEYAKAPNLLYCRQDATAFYSALTQRCGFPEDNVVLMTDRPVDGDWTKYPSENNLRDRIDQIARTAEPDDLLLIFFSGHGTRDGKGNGYLVPADGSRKRIDSLVPLSLVKTAVEHSAARQRLLILDACHAAARTAGGDGNAAGAILASLSGAGFLTLNSCDVDQLSHESPKLQHGVFTHALIEGLGGAANVRPIGNGDQTITAHELFNFAALRVKQWCLQTGKEQTPIREGRDSGQVELVRFDRAKGSSTR